MREHFQKGQHFLDTKPRQGLNKKFTGQYS